MFDFGFSELMLIGLVALIVVGPERLPKVARTAGHMLGKLQRYVSDVKSDIQREMQLEDLKKLQKEVEQQARDLESSVRQQMAVVESDLGKTASEVTAGLDDKSIAAPVGDAAVTPVTTAATEQGAADTPAPVSVAPKPEPQLELGLDEGQAVRQPAEKA
ncbi:MAG: Sec-independent protein translocase protein TatB [Rhodocyclaceae bacterium]